MPRQPRNESSAGTPPTTAGGAVATRVASGAEGKGGGRPLRAEEIDTPLLNMGGPEAVSAFLQYRNLGPGRSYTKLAAVWQAASGRSFTARVRSLERWGRQYGWVAKAIEWDIEQAERKRLAREQADEEMNDFQATANRAATLRSLQRIDALIALDEEDYNFFLAKTRAWRQADPNTRGDPPKPPRPRMSAHSLVMLFLNAQERERIARGVGEEQGAEGAGRGGVPMLPQVIEVRLATTPPPEPLDPYESENVVPAEVVAAHREALPPALASLPTRPPSDDDEESGDPEGDGWW